MKKKEAFADIGFICYIVSAVIALVIFLVSLGLEKSNEVPALFTDSWYGDISMTERADMKHPVISDGKCSFYAVVPDNIKAGDCLWFKAKNAFITVKVGEEERARITESEYAFLYGKTPGTDWVCVPLERADASQRIRIDFSTNYNDNSAYIDSVYIGNTMSTFRFAVLDRILGTVLCILIMLSGIILLIVYFAVGRHIKAMSKELLYLGFSVIFAGLWALCELRVMQLFTDKNAGVFHNLTCMSLMLMILPLVYYYKSDFDKKNKWIIPGVTVLTLLNFTVSSVLHFTGIADYHETLRFTHLTLGLGATLVIYANFMRCFKNPDRIKEDIPPAVCMILIGIATVVDMFRYSGGGINDSAFYSRIAIFAFSMALAVRSLLYVVNMVKIGVKSDIIALLAYEDGLTGLGNRTAFSEASEELQGKEVTVFVFDINNLKQVNDNFGHSAGDKLIVAGANMISAVFGKLGKCYRTGGDEFVCFADGAADGEALLEEFYRRIEEFNQGGKLGFPLMVAMGYEKYGGEGSFKEAIDAADKKMYQKKAELKAAGNGTTEK